MINHEINRLINFALQQNLITEEDKIYSTNLLLGTLKLNEFDPEDTDIKYLTQEFIVFYNFLPYLTDTIIKSLCNSAPCNNCDDKDEDKVLLERYYQVSMYLNCTGLYDKLPVLKSFVCDQTNMLIDRCEYIRYYGKFIFDYSDNIKKYFAYLYANLYKATILNIKEISPKVLYVILLKKVLISASTNKILP